MNWLAADWSLPGIRAVTTLRSGPGVSPSPWEMNLGDRCGDSATNVAENRRRLLELLALPAAPCWLRQVHGSRVVRVNAPAGPGWDPPEADGAFSSDPHAVLAVLTADCLPVALAATDGSVLGVAHAGWRGLAEGVIEALVAQMRRPGIELAAWLGPAIGPASFEIGPEVKQALIAADPGANGCFAQGQGDRWLADLYALATRRLRRSGVDRVHGGGEDTLADPRRFHSFRRDGERSGRMATLIWREPN